MSASTRGNRRNGSTTPTEDNDDPKRGWLSGAATYTNSVFRATRFGETRTNPGSGDPRYMITVVFVGDTLRERAKATIAAAIKAVVDDTYPDPKKMPPRGLRGVKREPLLKLVSDYPRMWSDCPDPDALFCRCASINAPILVDSDGNALTVESAQTLIKPGVLVHVAFGAFHYEQGGDPGIALGLEAVRYARPAYRIGFGMSPQQAAAGPGISDDELFGDLNI